MQNLFFPTYLPNQKIQGKGTANKQFFKDGLGDIPFCHTYSIDWDSKLVKQLWWAVNPHKKKKIL